MTFRLAARYADEVNIDAAVDEMAGAIAAVRGRCDEIGRDPATLKLATGTNPAWPYPGLKTIGRQRMMTQEDLPAIMDYDFSTILPRADELRRWVELGLDRVPLLCNREMDVPGAMERVIRVLAHYHAPGRHRPTHVYLGETQKLRADLHSAQ